ncbi:MAG: hypothetical protein HOW73_19395 [Polyangiaceae bacterium]|nr:hypothetical protein [Polyangiaceae bacterium]
MLLLAVTAQMPDDGGPANGAEPPGGVAWADRLRANRPLRLGGPLVEAFVDALVTAVPSEDGPQFFNLLDVNRAAFLGEGFSWETTLRRTVEAANNGQLNAVGVRELFLSALQIAPNNQRLLAFGDRLAQLAQLQRAQEGQEGGDGGGGSSWQRRWLAVLGACILGLAAVMLIVRVVDRTLLGTEYEFPARSTWSSISPSTKSFSQIRSIPSAASSALSRSPPPLRVGMGSAIPLQSPASRCSYRPTREQSAWWSTAARAVCLPASPLKM